MHELAHLLVETVSLDITYFAQQVPLLRETDTTKGDTCVCDRCPFALIQD